MPRRKAFGHVSLAVAQSRKEGFAGFSRTGLASRQVQLRHQQRSFIHVSAEGPPETAPGKVSQVATFRSQSQPQKPTRHPLAFPHARSGAPR